MNNDVEELFKFAFQPHFSKKYRVGDPNANKRHIQNRGSLTSHLLKIGIDPWLDLQTQYIRMNNENKIKHEMVN